MVFKPVVRIGLNMHSIGFQGGCSMRKKNHYDAIVIGTGTAGDTAAGILAEAGKSTAIIDKQPYGGTCALRGCQPKK